MRGLMMDEPLTLGAILDRASRYFPQVEVVSRRPDGTRSRIHYAALTKRVSTTSRTPSLSPRGRRDGTRPCA